MPEKDCTNPLMPVHDNGSSTMKEILQEFNHRELAEKVMAGKRLKISERNEIYCLLTGEQPNRKRKWTKSDVRNAHLTADYLTQASEEKGDLSDIRKALAKEYQLPGLENCSAETFYKAVRRGIEVLGAHCSTQLDLIENNLELGSEETADLFDPIGHFLDSQKKYTNKSNRTISKTLPMETNFSKLFP